MDGVDGGTVIDVISPHTQEPIGTVCMAGTADVDRAVRAARTAFDDGPWPRMQPAERIEALNGSPSCTKRTETRWRS